MVDKALDLQRDGLDWVSRRAWNHRQARMRLFHQLLATAKRPLRILDAGGLEAYVGTRQRERILIAKKIHNQRRESRPIRRCRKRAARGRGNQDDRSPIH